MSISNSNGGAGLFGGGGGGSGSGDDASYTGTQTGGAGGSGAVIIEFFNGTSYSTILQSSGSSYTVPAGTQSFKIWAIGGGGGGAGSIGSSGTSGGGGGAGGLSYVQVTATTGIIYYNIGLGGQGGVGGNNGTTGGTTTVTFSPQSISLSATGGTGGFYNTGAAASGGVGTGGTDSYTGGTGRGSSGDTGGGGGAINGGNATHDGGFAGDNGATSVDASGLSSALANINIPVPTSPLTAIANTSLLTCKTELIVDQSSNVFTVTKYGETKYAQLNPFSTLSSGSQSHSVTQVSILGVTGFNQTAVPVSTISKSVNITKSFASEVITPTLIYNPVGSPNLAVQTIYSNRFARQTDDNVGNEATEPVLVYIQDTVINSSNKPTWIVNNGYGYTPRSSAATVNADKIPDSYERPALSNAFSITTANKPNVLSRHISSFSNLATTTTIFGQSLLESFPLEPITKTVITESIVASQVRTTLSASQGVNSGLSRSFTLAPYGTAGALVIGEGGLLVSAQTEFWN
jgi:hypothetical protein